MIEVKMETPIRQHEDFQKNLILPRYSFVEESLSILPICTKYQITDTVQLFEKTKEYERLKESLEISHGEMAKLYMQFTKDYEVLLNNCMKKFLDFTIFLKTQSESNENVIAALKSENDNLKNELESLRLRNLTLNSNLKLAHDLLNEEKLQREQIESGRKNLEYLSEKLCSLLLKYQHRIHQLEEVKETTNRASCDDLKSSIKSDSNLPQTLDTLISEDSLDEDNFSDICDYNDELLILPPFDFRDDNISPKIVDSNEKLSRVKESLPNVSDENSTNLTPSSSQKTPCLSILASNVCNAETDECLHTTQESNDVNSSKDALNTTISKRKKIDGLKPITPDSSACYIFPEPAKTNENLPSQNSNEFSNSTITSYQSHFEYETCGKYFLKEENLTTPICNGNSNNHGEKYKRKLSIVVSEGEKNGDSEKTEDFPEKCQNEISSLRCVICSRQYSSKSYLRAHIRHVHHGEKSHKCAECGKRFSQKGSLKLHISTHLGSKKPFKCAVCNVGFKHLSTKRKHERIIHERGSRFQCAHCDKRFGGKRQLIFHIHSKHFSGLEKQFKCTMCEKSFASKRGLQTHKRMHTSPSFVKCSVCDRLFKNLNEKARHELAVHGKGIRFRCKHCDRGYKYKAFLIRHLRSDHVTSSVD